MGPTWSRLALLWPLAAVLGTGCAQLGSFSASRPGSASASNERPFALARLTERKGKLSDAEQMYRSLQTRNTADPGLEHRLGVVAARQGKLEEARRHFNKAVDLGGENAEVMADLGYCCYLMEDLPAAETALRSALAHDPNNRRARNNLGLVVGEQGRFEESLAEFKRAGSEAEAHANLAYVHSQLGQLQQATEEYNLALSLNKNLRPAAQALVQIAKDEPAHEQARQVALSRQRMTSPGPQPQPQPQQQPAPPTAVVAAMPRPAAPEAKTVVAQNPRPAAPQTPVQMAAVPNSRPADAKDSVARPAARPADAKDVAASPAAPPAMPASAPTRVLPVAHTRSPEEPVQATTALFRTAELEDTVSAAPVAPETASSSAITISDYRIGDSEGGRELPFSRRSHRRWR